MHLAQTLSTERRENLNSDQPWEPSGKLEGKGKRRRILTYPRSIKSPRIRPRHYIFETPEVTLTLICVKNPVLKVWCLCQRKSSKGQLTFRSCSRRFSGYPVFSLPMQLGILGRVPRGKAKQDKSEGLSARALIPESLCEITNHTFISLQIPTPKSNVEEEASKQK